jgi:lipoyl(octanoyl) transferase
MGVKQYVRGLEEAVIKTLARYNIRSGRLEGATGVWLDTDQPGKTRKICAIGVKVSRQVTMHGLAFNVNTNLDYYGLINPCGFTDKGVTSMENELGHPVSMADVKTTLSLEIARVFKFEFEEIE